MNMSRGSSAAASLESALRTGCEPDRGSRGAGDLVVDLQARGLRVEVPLERRTGGAGPSDSGMLWVGGFPLTVPTDNAAAAGLAVRAEGRGRRLRHFRGRSSGWPAPRPSNAHASTTSPPPTASPTGRSA